MKSVMIKLLAEIGFWILFIVFLLILSPLLILIALMAFLADIASIAPETRDFHGEKIPVDYNE